MKCYITKKDMPFVPKGTDIVDRRNEGWDFLIWESIKLSNYGIVVTFIEFILREHKDEYFTELK